jgi:hypothetical protein
VLIKGNEVCVLRLETLIWVFSKEWSLFLLLMQYFSGVILINKEDAIVGLMRGFSIVNLGTMLYKIT